LDQIINLDSKKFTLSKTRDIFIFSCFTGLSYIDVKHFTTDHIVWGIDEINGYTLQEKKEQHL
tara:strand:- start:31670 stop:31858 length:189 start_codon:yes stop_codon:yes gene_type:complete